MYRVIESSNPKHREVLGCVGKIEVAIVGFNMELRLLFDECDNSINQLVTFDIVESIAINENRIFITTAKNQYILENVE